MLPLWIRGEVSLHCCCPLILVDQILQVPIINVIVLPVRGFVEFQVVSELHACVLLFSYWYADLWAILLVARKDSESGNDAEIAADVDQAISRLRKRHFNWS